MIRMFALAALVAGPAFAEVAIAERPSAPPAPPSAAAKPRPFPANWPSPCPPAGLPHVAGTVLVGMDPKATDADRAKVRQAAGVLAERSLMLPGVWVMRVPCDADIPAICKKLAALPGVKYAEPDGIVQLDDPIEGR